MKRKLELNINKINNPSYNVQQLGVNNNSAKSKNGNNKTLESKRSEIINPLTQSTKTIKPKPKVNFNIQKICQNIVSSISNTQTSQSNRNKNNYLSGKWSNINVDSQLGELAKSTTLARNSGTSMITSPCSQTLFETTKGTKASMEKKNSQIATATSNPSNVNTNNTNSNAPGGQEPILSKKEKLNYLRKLVLSTQKQISLTEKQLKIHSNTGFDNNTITFERKPKNLNQPAFPAKNTTPKGDASTFTNTVLKNNEPKKPKLTHKKQTKSDFLSSQIASSINAYLKSKLVSSGNKQITPQNRTSVPKEMQTSETKEATTKTDSKSAFQSKKTTEIVHDEPENNGMDLISTIQSVNNLLSKAQGTTFNMNNNFNININFNGQPDDKKSKADQEKEVSSNSNNTQLDHSSKLLDNDNRLKRDTFVGKIKNRKDFKNIGESDLFVVEKESNCRIKKYDAILNFISSNLREISELVSMDDKTNKSGTDKDNSSKQAQDPQEDGAYLCKNLKVLTDPEYEALLFHKLRENKFMSIESGDSQINSKVLPKSNFSKEIMSKDLSFIVSSINDEIYKNLIKEDLTANNPGRNLSISSLTSAIGKSHLSAIDKTDNQYNFDDGEDNLSDNVNNKNRHCNNFSSPKPQNSKVGKTDSKKKTNNNSVDFSIQRKVATEVELDEEERLEQIEKREQNCLIF